MVRHKTSFPVSGALELAARDSARVARRGVGPPHGKEPAPVPRPGDPLYSALCAGIWYLLRVSELTALNLEDVRRLDGAGTQRTALLIRKTKTDQERGVESWSHENALVTCRRRAPGRAEREIRQDGWARYGTHSLRVAGVMAACDAGLQEETVKALGRWTSTRAMYAYLRGTPYAKAAWAAQCDHGQCHGQANCLPGPPDERSLTRADKGLLLDVPCDCHRNSLTGLIHRVQQQPRRRCGTSGQKRPEEERGPDMDWIRPLNTGVEAMCRGNRDRAELRHAKAQLRVCTGQRACSHDACNPDRPVWDMMALDGPDTFPQYLARADLLAKETARNFGTPRHNYVSVPARGRAVMTPVWDMMVLDGPDTFLQYLRQSQPAWHRPVSHRAEEKQTPRIRHRSR
eukprot:s1062_g6.t2